MIKPILDLVNQLNAHMLLLPSIVDELAKKENSSSDKLMNWLRIVEHELQKAGYPQCAEIAGLRATLLAPEFNESNRSSRKKEKLAVASQTVNQAQKIIMDVLKPNKTRIEETRNLIRQILLIIQPSGLLDNNPGVSFNDFIQGIWHSVKSNEQFSSGTIKILSVMNQSDVLRILAEEIDLQD